MHSLASTETCQSLHKNRHFSRPDFRYVLSLWLPVSREAVERGLFSLANHLLYPAGTNTTGFTEIADGKGDNRNKKKQ